MNKSWGCYPSSLQRKSPQHPGSLLATESGFSCLQPADLAAFSSDYKQTVMNDQLRQRMSSNLILGIHGHFNSKNSFHSAEFPASSALHRPIIAAGQLKYSPHVQASNRVMTATNENKLDISFQQSLLCSKLERIYIPSTRNLLNHLRSMSMTRQLLCVDMVEQTHLLIWWCN